MQSKRKVAPTPTKPNSSEPDERSSTMPGLGGGEPNRCDLHQRLKEEQRGSGKRAQGRVRGLGLGLCFQAFWPCKTEGDSMGCMISSAWSVCCAFVSYCRLGSKLSAFESPLRYRERLQRVKGSACSTNVVNPDFSNNMASNLPMVEERSRYVGV